MAGSRSCPRTQTGSTIFSSEFVAAARTAACLMPAWGFMLNIDTDTLGMDASCFVQANAAEDAGEPAIDRGAAP